MAEQIFRNITKELRPAKAPRFHAGNKNDAATAAIRTSAYHNRTAYLFATYSGYKVNLDLPSLPIGNSYESITAVYDQAEAAYTVNHYICQVG